MPPPFSARPPVIATPEMATRAPLWMRSMRLAGRVDAIVAPGPATTMSRSPVMSRSPHVAGSPSQGPPRVRLYVPAGRTIVSAPFPAGHSPAMLPDGRSPLAASTASRKVQRPSPPARTSNGLLTVMVDAARPLAGSASRNSSPMKMVQLRRLLRKDLAFGRGGVCSIGGSLDQLVW